MGCQSVRAIRPPVYKPMVCQCVFGDKRREAVGQLSQTNRRLRHSDENSIILNSRKKADRVQCQADFTRDSSLFERPCRDVFAKLAPLTQGSHGFCGLILYIPDNAFTVRDIIAYGEDVPNLWVEAVFGK